jgi:hypothetical protein
MIKVGNTRTLMCTLRNTILAYAQASYKVHGHVSEVPQQEWKYSDHMLSRHYVHVSNAYTHAIKIQGTISPMQYKAVTVHCTSYKFYYWES